jgi:hypothetical protein
MPLFEPFRFQQSPGIPKDFPRIFLFGDSLTDRAFFEQNCGFGWKLREYYANRIEVINEGRLRCRSGIFGWMLPTLTRLTGCSG